MRKITILFLVLCVSVSLQARHIIGGTVEYTINSVIDDMVDIDVIFHVYRDATSGGASFDQNIYIGLYAGDDDPLLDFIALGSSAPNNVETIDFSELLDCVPSSINMQSAIYEANFVVDLKNYERFIISYQRCCRSETVSNILDGEVTGIALSVEITRSGMERLGAVQSFDNIFPVFNLSGEENNFDFSINDGLTKRYKLSDAQTAGGDDGVNQGNSLDCTGVTPNPEICPPPYSAPSYVTGSGAYGLYDEVSIDSLSGILTTELALQGSYLVAVEADSYENGELLSTVYQQFVQVVSMCEPNNVKGDDLSDLNKEIYPVPARDMIYFAAELSKVTVFDSKGINVLTQSLFNNDSGINVSGLLPGVYILTGLNNKGEKVTKRFVK